VLLLAIILCSVPQDIFAQGPPPPPGVPLDFGLFAFLACCVGYGVKKLKDKSK
jgi:hypothetical protein